MKYDEILRVIGQELDSLKPTAYEVVCYGNCYLVRCRVKHDPATAKEQENKVKRLPAFLRLWREKEKPSDTGTAEAAHPAIVELFYHLDDIKRLAEDHRRPPTDPDAMPDAYSFSYILGVVGESVDRKPNARLLFASNRGQEGQKIVVLYQTEQGTRALEEYPISGFYDLWVQEYVKKKR
jgi:hypothetical protein